MQGIAIILHIFTLLFLSNCGSWVVASVPKRFLFKYILMNTLNSKPQLPKTLSLLQVYTWLEQIGYSTLQILQVSWVLDSPISVDEVLQRKVEGRHLIKEDLGAIAWLSLLFVHPGVIELWNEGVISVRKWLQITAGYSKYSMLFFVNVYKPDVWLLFAKAWTQNFWQVTIHF